MFSRNSLAFAGPRDEAARTAAKSRLSSPRTTPAIKDSVHLHPCSFQDMNSMALSASGRSAVNSLTFAHSSRATALSLSHNMRKWPREKICGCMGMSSDPRTNLGRYRGRPWVPGATQWEYSGVP